MLRINQNVLVATKTEGKWHSSVIMDIYKEELLISHPRFNREELIVADNDRLEISFSQNGIRYRYESGFSQKIGDILVIQKPRLLEKIDLRRYPRVKVDLDLFFSEISGRETASGDKREGRIVDISGNGLKFTVDRLYTPGDYMNINFNLPLAEKTVPVEAECRIVRIIVNDCKDPVEYQLGAEISRISGQCQKYIIDYVCSKNTDDV